LLHSFWHFLVFPLKILFLVFFAPIFGPQTALFVAYGCIFAGHEAELGRLFSKRGGFGKLFGLV